MFNAATYLLESLESLFAQTYRPLEILVMDDASTDATPEMLSAHADRLTVVRQPRNLGQFANVNEGLSRACGDVVIVFHADDVARPEMVEQGVEVLERHREVTAVFSKDVFIDAEGHQWGRFEYPLDFAGGGLVSDTTVLNWVLTHKNNLLRGGGVAVRAEALRAVGNYRDEREIANDLDMWLRLAWHGPMWLLDEHLWAYRSGYGSSSDHYKSLRTEPESFFRIVDRQLERSAQATADPKALCAYEAHRAKDLVRVAAARYASDQDASETLHSVSVRRLMATQRWRRGRHLSAFVALWVLVRLPPIPVAGAILRWQLARLPPPA